MSKAVRSTTANNQPLEQSGHSLVRTVVVVVVVVYAVWWRATARLAESGAVYTITVDTSNIPY